MPISFAFPAGTDLVIIRLIGLVSRAENDASRRAVLSHPGTPGMRRLLTLTSDLSGTEVDSADMRRTAHALAASAVARARPLSAAISARDDSLGFAMGRMFQSFATGLPGFAETQVLTPPQAEDWAGLDEAFDTILDRDGHLIVQD
ncbi:hypothetical protein ATO6_04785 [Oceanicola sp. 22II-s10i]|uniref:hypothetical protein n=1 Tax=Oceanicola sp. 22II-s10i TaxID=1317116 RepID=UPI000B523FB1|nr:hypothetical protein [Oceanicola sp. 22II-s10i]OWU86171.1 hypothetical protein ATO6_04785 [Oceanicola sp. 22II-s10i]